MSRLVSRLWHEIGCLALIALAVAALVYLMGAEPWRDPAGRH